MFLGRVKNFIISFLVILAVYQTAKLWFEDFSNHNFFYTILNRNSADYTQQSCVYTLNSLIINKGNNKFERIYNDIYKSDYKSVLDRAVTLCLKEGKSVKLNEDYFKTMMNSKFIMYKYDYKLTGETVGEMFNVKGNNISKISEFDTIVLIPSINVPETLHISFIDNDSYNITGFEVIGYDVIKDVYNLIDLFSMDNENIYYISSFQNGFDIFKKNVFIPSWDSTSIVYKPITMVNDMESAGSVLMMSLEKNIDIFFDNPAVKWPTRVNDVYTYSDETTVVKYYTNGVLEYSNYKSGNETNKNSSFYDKYISAINFMQKDINIKNEYYLSSYLKEDDKYTFYFDYKINNFPIILSDEIKRNIGMKSMIEVTVSGNTVVRYKRYVYNFEIDESNKKYINVDFLKAVDYVFSKIQNNENKSNKDIIDDIILGYTVFEQPSEIQINWGVEIDDNMYFVPAQ